MAGMIFGKCREVVGATVWALTILAFRSVPSGPAVSECAQIDEPSAHTARIEEYYRIYGQTYEQ